MAKHTHAAYGLQQVTSRDDSNSPVNNYNGTLFAEDNGQSVQLNGYSNSTNGKGAANGVEVTLWNTGASLPVNNMEPYVVVNWCIATQPNY